MTTVFWVLGTLLNISILVFSVTPPGNQLPPLPHFDKLIHFSAYFATTLWHCGITDSKNKFKILAYNFCLGLAVELIQGLIPYRSMSLLDLLANSLGILVASQIIAWLKKNRFSLLGWPRLDKSA